jgi:hypothetical protein
MLAQCSFGNAAVRNKIGNRHLAVQMAPNVVDRYLEIVRNGTLER